MEEIVLKLTDLNKKFPNATALTNVSFALRSGHSYALIGERGSGKTTLFRILTGLIKKTSGKIEILGKTGRDLTKARKQVGALVDIPTFCSHLNIRQNLMAQLLTLNNTKKERIDRLLTAMNITKDVTGRRKISSCPSGYKQSYAIVSALLGSPQLLLLDGAFTGLDVESSERFISLLKAEMADRQMTVLMSGNNFAELYQCSSDFIFIDSGRVILEISRDELMKRFDNEPNDAALNSFYMQLIKEAVK